jgi:hypothetical protein
MLFHNIYIYVICCFNSVFYFFTISVYQILNIVYIYIYIYILDILYIIFYIISIVYVKNILDIILLY